MKPVGLIDIDSMIPNLALMKISQKMGNAELTTPLFAEQYDSIYASEVFSWSVTPVLPERAVIGGVGSSEELDEDVNNLCPDYDLYGIDYSMGFLTRGCPRKCKWCIVPDKEGGIRPEHDADVFVRHNKVLLLDNNVLAHPFGLEQIEKLAGLRVAIDFNQGLDARLIDKGVAKLLAKCRWWKPIRLACDSDGMMKPVEKAVKLLREAGATPSAYSCYVLVEDVPSAFNRVEFLRRLGVDPFAQPYRAPSGKEPSKHQKRFARWVNHKAIFKTVLWEAYK